ncbi:MAG TPA: Crp/Fnr family transcriptional regulator [Gammaproteobacteria bacterium]|nr:Crp/Fnr family transcriptional regulator [Gammaproteobacteria bacterium]
MNPAQQKMSQQLAQIFAALPEAEQKTLLEFAEFLKSRAPQVEAVPSEPLQIPRPDEESVIAAIKRLNQTYPMVERKSLLNETSDLMMQHMMRGRAAMEIIDELEALFERKFQEFVDRNS